MPRDSVIERARHGIAEDQVLVYLSVLREVAYFAETLRGDSGQPLQDAGIKLASIVLPVLQDVGAHSPELP